MALSLKNDGRMKGENQQKKVSGHAFLFSNIFCYLQNTLATCVLTVWGIAAVTAVRYIGWRSKEVLEKGWW